MTQEIGLNWQGPFRFGVSKEEDLPPNEAGVYVWTVPIGDEFLLAYVGECGGIVSRWSDHVCYLLGGFYQVYDVELLRSGKELRTIYERKNEKTNLLNFSRQFVEAAWENAVTYDLFWALFPSDRRLRMAVESAIHSSLANRPEGRLIQNGRISVYSENALKVRCSMKWPEGISIAGLPNELEYGEIEGAAS